MQWSYNPEEYWREFLAPMATEVQQAIPRLQPPGFDVAGRVIHSISDAHHNYLRTISKLMDRASQLQQAISTMELGGKRLLAPGMRALAGELNTIYRTMPALIQGQGALPIAEWGREIESSLLPARYAGRMARAGYLAAQTAALPYTVAMAYPGEYTRGMQGIELARMLSPEEGGLGREYIDAFHSWLFGLPSPYTTQKAFAETPALSSPVQTRTTEALPTQGAW